MEILILILIAAIAVVALLPAQATQVLLVGSWAALALMALGSIGYALSSL
jgi:hypothetical protein